MAKPIKRVVIVDDSPLMRQILSTILSESGLFDVVGIAGDPIEAREVIRNTNPDVITLDVEMPRMDGISFLEKIMRLKPTPTVMISSLTTEGAEITLRALELGAVDCIAKPTQSVQESFARSKEEIVRIVYGAAGSKPTAMPRMPAARPKAAPRSISTKIDLIAIGASTGGVAALHDIMSVAPDHMPPIAIVQHMPESYVQRFTERLNENSAITIQVAQEGQVLETGNAYVAPGGRHLTINRKTGRLIAEINDLDPCSGHRPSVDMLFNSVAATTGRRSIGVILTGMGRDGAGGMLKMKKEGAKTLGQNEASSVVYGMNKAAASTGAIDAEIDINNMTQAIVDLL